MTSDTRRRALVTGASSGIGRATAIALATAGIDLVLLGRSTEKLKDLQASLAEWDVQVKIQSVDLAALADVKGTIAALCAEQPVDILINNAGMGYTGPLASMALADWQRVMDLNLTSVLLCMQAVLPGMRDRGTGTIINIASVAAYNAFPDWGAYSVSKAGLVTLSRIFSAEERGNGIRVTVLAPGAVNTPLWDTDTVDADFPRSQMLTPEIVAQAIVDAVNLPSTAVVEELKLMPSGGAL
jgi:short-subunit dehydrogenase